MVKLICISFVRYNIKLGGIYDGELYDGKSLANMKYWKIYTKNKYNEIIYSYVDGGEFMELSEYRNKQLDKLGIDG